MINTTQSMKPNPHKSLSTHNHHTIPSYKSLSIMAKIDLQTHLFMSLKRGWIKLGLIIYKIQYKKICHFNLIIQLKKINNMLLKV